MTRASLHKSWLFAGALSVALAGAVPSSAAPGDNVILLADTVFLEGGSILTARGNVEAISGDIVLTADAIIYNSVTDTITITGPIRIEDGGSVELFAEFAELDADLQNGLLNSARLVLAQQVELKADEIRRIDGNVSELTEVQVTSCQTCADETPLWYIRAAKVTHNEADQRLYLDQAQLRVLDVPVFYMPRLSLPDPTLDRASGFLIPSFKQRTRIGTGVKIPYFFAIGDHRDITVTPYISANMATIEGRYRQAYVNGEIELNGAITDDNFGGIGTRAYLFADGAFELENDYQLRFDAKLTSDNAYLLDYDYSSLDRLNSLFEITRSDKDEDTRFGLNTFRSLRSTEVNRTLPGLVLNARTERRFEPSFIGGTATWQAEFHSHGRDSDTDIVGRDVARINGGLSWNRDWWSDFGTQFELQSALTVDMIETSQDSSVLETSYLDVTPSFGATLRYPLTRSTADGVQLLEPVVHIAWSGGAQRGGTTDTVANDESTRNEFDEGNLVALSRFTSVDRRERGFALALGTNWAHFGQGFDAKLSMGQIYRTDAQNDFTISSGLKGTTSDFLLAGQMQLENGLNLLGRSLIDDKFSLAKAEATAGWQNERLDLSASYVWLAQDPEENRPDILAEWNLDSSYRMTRHWTGLANIRYDVAANQTTEAGFGLEYQNECVKAEIGVSRRFTSSTSVLPVTDVSFTVELLGFSAKTGDKSYSRKCKAQGF